MPEPSENIDVYISLFHMPDMIGVISLQHGHKHWSLHTMLQNTWYRDTI